VRSLVNLKKITRTGSPKHPAISVVVASYNQEKTVKKCMESLLDQKTNVKYEIVVIDSSNNNAHNILKTYAPRIKLIHRSKRTYCGEARNIGIKNAKGDIIALTDTDCVVDKNWINNIYAAHEKHDVVGGRILNGNPQNIFGWSLFLMEFGKYAINRNKVIKTMAGANVSYKKNIFQKYGRLPSLILPVDDLIFNSRLQEEIFFSKDIIIRHTNKTNLLEIIKYSYSLGRGFGFVIKESDKGKFLAKYPFLSPLLVLQSFFVLGHKTMHFPIFFMFILTSPFIFINYIAWTVGASKEII